MSDLFRLPAAQAVATVRAGKASVSGIVGACLARIEARNAQLNAFTTVLADSARKRARELDAKIARGESAGPLAGAVFSVKNLYDVAGVVTLAGAKLNEANPPAKTDAALIAKLEDAGAVLVGAVGMGEYAYDFTGENAHYGATRNPHDPAHMSGGSSGGSGSAVASGMCQISLGSDTNGSIRVPSSFCGLFGLKPTYGRLSRSGSFPFVASLDHLGPLARSVEDLALSYDAMQGGDDRDPAQAPRAVEPAMPEIAKGVGRLRIARAGGYFAKGGEAQAFAAVEHVCAALGVSQTIDIPEAARARAAAYLITMAEGAALHLKRLQADPHGFDPAVRDRLMAGAMLPAGWIAQAHKVRRACREAVLRLFEDVDVIIAPATPCSAPKLGQATFVLDGIEMPVRPNIGIYTQPISFVGLPVAAVPVWLKRERLPIGVQVIAAPWREDIALRAAHALETQGIAMAPVAD